MTFHYKLSSFTISLTKGQSLSSMLLPNHMYRTGYNNDKFPPGTQEPGCHVIILQRYL